jgi:peptide deformylase
MRLPILAYGHGLLRQICPDADITAPTLATLINNLWDTMQGANGCGLAASQVGQVCRLFIVDSTSTYENLDGESRIEYFGDFDSGIRETFINARILERSVRTWIDEEGCLSIPGLSRPVKRHWSIRIAYTNADLMPNERTFSGMTARMIQHEYDHTEGVLYIDHLAPLSRQLIDRKLQQIAKGKFSVPYPIM